MNELDRIIAELDSQRSALDRALSALRQVDGAGGNGSEKLCQPEAATTNKRGITPAGRTKLSEALQRRWAQKRAAQANEERAQKNAAAAQKRRATLARKRRSETMKQHWAVKRAAEVSQKTAKGPAVNKRAAYKRATKHEVPPTEA